MNQRKVNDLGDKILSELENFNVTLKYGHGDLITLKLGSKPMITKDGWLIILSEDTKEQKYIDLESVYELILDVNF